MGTPRAPQPWRSARGDRRSRRPRGPSELARTLEIPAQAPPSNIRPSLRHDRHSGPSKTNGSSVRRVMPPPSIQRVCTGQTCTRQTGVAEAISARSAWRGTRALRDHAEERTTREQARPERAMLRAERRTANRQAHRDRCRNGGRLKRHALDDRHTWSGRPRQRVAIHENTRRAEVARRRIEGRVRRPQRRLRIMDRRWVTHVARSRLLHGMMRAVQHRAQHAATHEGDEQQHGPKGTGAIHGTERPEEKG